MKFRSICLGFTMGLLLAGAACSPPAQPEPASTPVGPPPAADALNGTWSGNWGPSPSDRNDVIVELKWDGAALTGVVNPGPNAIPLTKAAYDAATGGVMMEADAPARGGGTVHFVIDGKAAGNSMSGCSKQTE